MPSADEMFDAAFASLSAPAKPQEAPLTLWQKLGNTWPARMAKDAYAAFQLPGQVYRGEVPMYGEDGQINPDVIRRSADLAGVVTVGAGAMPAGASELRAGIRPYQNVPQGLMGFRRGGPQKGYEFESYKKDFPVRVVFPKSGYLPAEILVDRIKGLNADHAVERAYRNWPEAIHVDTFVDGLKSELDSILK